jgi:GNAT superfamily N-acetyltransferase
VNKYSLIQITFEEILPYWRDRLWPNRVSPIEPASSMLYLGGYDITIKYFYDPIFFAVKDNNQIVGVNSGHQTGDYHYRSRGIWTTPEAQKNGVGRMLIDAVEIEAKLAKCNKLWSIPRQSAMPFYLKCGFTQTSDFFDEIYEFGPNAYACKEIDQIAQK